MKKIKEQDLSEVIKSIFNEKTILMELDGIVEGHISFIDSDCQYNYKNGILYLFDLINNLRIDIASQYKILFDESKKILKIKLDNKQNLTLTVIK